MRRMGSYIHLFPHWPRFTWNQEQISPLLAEIRNRQGRLLGRMGAMGFQMKAESSLQTLTLDVLKSSEIEGEILDIAQVRSSLARRMGMDLAGLVPSDRFVDGVVEMLLDATQNYQQPLSADRLFGWHAALFPTGRSGMHQITVAAWRDNKNEEEMQQFINWFNQDELMEPVIKAAIAHLWFITIHPFDDGNGRIACAITDLQLARADGSCDRFYSMSAQIRKQRKYYYEILESTQKGSMDITAWLRWFLTCFWEAIEASSETLSAVLQKARFWEKHATTLLNQRQQIMLNKLLDGLDGKLNSSKWAKMTKTSSDTALRDIQDLLNKKILVKEIGGGRSTCYELNINF